MEQILLTIPAAASRLSLGRSKLYELLTANELHAVRIGRAVRVSTAEVDAYAARLLAEATADAVR
ncbi:MAG: excisionase family DNA-binding protein [Dehalococcoidia bacterium]|nr:excisionase family DNA-binding protein [Dehalococcoidia bacterium]